MITRRALLGGAVGVGTLVLTPAVAAAATENKVWNDGVSANGWVIDPAAIVIHRVEGSGASLALRRGPVATILLHVARRWHYEISPVDTGEGGGVTGFTSDSRVNAEFESNYLSGTAIALHPRAFPLRGSEPLWPRHETVVRDILRDCAGTVIWGGGLVPAKLSHFQIDRPPGDRKLAIVASRLGPDAELRFRSQRAGRVIDPS